MVLWQEHVCSSMKKRITRTPLRMSVTSSSWQPSKMLPHTCADPQPASFIGEETILYKILYRANKSNASCPKRGYLTHHVSERGCSRYCVILRWSKALFLQHGHERLCRTDSILVYSPSPAERALVEVIHEKRREHQDRSCHRQAYTSTATLVLYVPQRWRPSVHPRW